jgi:glycosyltransferase involved in cell wall biosynthesis
MKSDALYEKKTFANVKHVIGRTQWDRIGSKLINPKVEYHYNAESMRQSFYGEEWSRETCQERRIFAAQGYYPLKGFHILLQALTYLKTFYPDVCVRVGGYNNAFQSGIRQTAYGKYLRSIIRSNNLESNVKYVGLLSEKEMLGEYKQAEVFVSPSAIENSSNSIAEAMLLGMPVVASNVGGTPDMLEDHEEGLLYQWDSPEMLAYSLKRLFDSKELELDLASRAKARAITRQEFQTNYSTLMSIYTKCLRDE